MQTKVAIETTAAPLAENATAEPSDDGATPTAAKGMGARSLASSAATST